MGSPKQTIIEINGKRYDARTGRLLETKKPQTAKVAPKATVKPARAGGRVTDQIRRPLQRSQTLMRTAVKRPAPKATVKPAKPRSTSDIRPVRASGGHTVAKPILHSFDVARADRAKQIKQSKLVSKFGGPAAKHHPVGAAPVARRVEPLSVKPAPVLSIPHKSNTVESMLEKGLKNAQSHNQKFEPKKRAKAKAKRSPKAKLASYGAGALAAVLLAGFIAYQNIPNISVRYAATRSGIHASLPGYQPAGFALSNRIHYSPGQITLNFSSNSDEREFTITQRDSSWNSDTLLNNYVSAKADRVQKYEDKGRTIYIYDGNNATWVNGGVWYDINGDSELNPDQLVRIATSM